MTRIKVTSWAVILALLPATSGFHSDSGLHAAVSSFRKGGRFRTTTTTTTATPTTTATTAPGSCVGGINNGRDVLLSPPILLRASILASAAAIGSRSRTIRLSSAAPATTLWAQGNDNAQQQDGRGSIGSNNSINNIDNGSGSGSGSGANGESGSDGIDDGGGKSRGGKATSTAGNTSSSSSSNGVGMLWQQGVANADSGSNFVATFTTTQIDGPSSPSRSKESSRRRKNYGAPLVDSTLLRFLSVQKKQWQPTDGTNMPLASMTAAENTPESLLRQYGIQQTMSSNFNESLAVEPMLASSTKTDAIVKDLVNVLVQNDRAFQLSKSEPKTVDTKGPANGVPSYYESEGTANTENISSQNGVATECKAEESSEDATANKERLQSQDVVVTSSVDPWMGQYNRNRIAQTLVALGVDDESALLAGEKVQELVLVRTARRRVRTFLRLRDSLWSTNGKDGVVNKDPLTDNNPLRNEDLPHPEYGFDDVVKLMRKYGLTGKDIAAILAHSPSVALMMPCRSMTSVNDRISVDGKETGKNAVSAAAATGETLEETLNRAFVGLLTKTLKLRRYDARWVLRFCPGLLSMRGSKSAVQVVAMLTKIGVSTKSIAREPTKLPTLLSRSPAAMFRLVAFLASDAVRMPVRSIGPLLRRAECRPLLDAVAPIPRVQALNQGRNGDDSGEGSRIDGRRFSMIDNPVDDPNVASAIWGRGSEVRRQRLDQVFVNMTETAWTLRNRIGTQDLGKVVAAYPSVLLLDAEKQVLPVASYLMDELGILEGDLPRVLQLYPVLLGKNIRDMQRVESYLISLGVEESNLSIILRAFPALLNMDIESMKPVVNYLRSIGVEDVGRIVTRLPPILGYSVERELIPKWKLLQAVNKYAKFEMLRFPAYFSYPLERVIQTRYAYLIHKGLSTDFAVDAVVRSGDVDFAKYVAGDADGGARFRAYSEARRKEMVDKERRRANSDDDRTQRPTQERSETLRQEKSKRSKL